MYPNGYLYSTLFTSCVKPFRNKRTRWIVPMLLILAVNAAGVYRIYKKLQARDQDPAGSNTQLVNTDIRDSTLKTSTTPTPDNAAGLH